MTDEEERELRIDIMQMQLELYKAQLRWEPWKALSAMIAAAAVFAGGVLAVSNWIKPPNQPPMFPPGTIIQIPPAPPAP